ncbi:MAG: hypothetical protein ACFB01_14405 [Cohaesibacteraceae bacterium]
MDQPPPLPSSEDTGSAGSKPPKPKERLWRRLLGWLMLPFRLIGYAALITVTAAFAFVFSSEPLGLCRSNGPGLTCSSDAWQSLADLGLSIMLLSVFTGLPLILAFAGLIFLSLDFARWLHRRKN